MAASEMRASMELQELATALIGVNTENPPGNEEGCARLLQDYIEGQGLQDCETELQRFDEGRANLIVKIGRGEPGLLLAGHTDVVPAGDRDLWSVGPFDARVADGRLYGRGAADMKTGLAAMVQAISSMGKRERLRRRLVFVATGGEEVGFNGAGALVKSGRLTKEDAIYGVVGEPTEGLAVRGHKGISTLRLTFKGRSAHASRPDLGINAIENCSRFMEALRGWRAEVEKVKNRDLGRTVMSATVINGGTKSNAIPESCDLTIDCRRIPEVGEAEILRGLSRTAAGLKRADRDFHVEIRPVFSAEALNLSRRNVFVRMVENASGAPSTIAPYATEAPLYNGLGISTVVLGPGSVRQAHTADEYVDLGEAKKASSVYSALIREVCA